MDYWYRLDHQDRISAVSPSFDFFSRANGGPAGFSRQVVGRPVWDFVQGEELQTILKGIFERARQGTVRLPMRCDSPGEMRLLEMAVTPELQVCFTELKSEPRLPPDWLTVCSWCNQVPPEQTQVMLGPEVKITHGICSRCERAFEDGDFDHLEF
jgi:hypothetical protein